MLPVEALEERRRGQAGFFDGTIDPLGLAYRRFYSLDFHLERHEMGWVDVGAQKIFVQLFARRGERRGRVFLLHGYLDHSGIQGPTIKRLLDLGHDVITVDHVGHGFSTGDRASTGSFQIYVDSLEAARERYEGGRADIVMGHSLGGAVAMTHMLQHPHRFDRAVLIAPLYRPKSWQLLRAIHVVGRHFLKGQPRLWRNNTRDLAYRHFIREVDPLSPRYIPIEWINAMFAWIRDFRTLEPVIARVLVVQGTNDGTVDWRGNLPMIRSRFSDVEVHIVREGMHQLLNEIDVWRDRTWIPIEPFLSEGSHEG